MIASYLKHKGIECSVWRRAMLLRRCFNALRKYSAGRVHKVGAVCVSVCVCVGGGQRPHTQGRPAAVVRASPSVHWAGRDLSRQQPRTQAVTRLHPWCELSK